MLTIFSRKVAILDQAEPAAILECMPESQSDAHPQENSLMEIGNATSATTVIGFLLLLGLSSLRASSDDDGDPCGHSDGQETGVDLHFSFAYHGGVSFGVSGDASRNRRAEKMKTGRESGTEGSCTCPRPLADDKP